MLDSNAIDLATSGAVAYLSTAPDARRTVHIDPEIVREEVDAEIRVVQVADGRPEAGGHTLDRNGFRLIHAPSRVADFRDEWEIKAKYEPEIEALLKERVGAEEVVIFDHTIRVDGGETGARKPVRRVHSDYTVKSGPQRVRDLIAPENQDRWLSGRYGVVNVWRPIVGPVQRSPLAFIDAATVAPEDFRPIDLVYPDRIGEIYGVVANDAHRWVYFPKMTAEEAVLIRTFDSDETRPVRFSAHAAIDDPSTPASAPARESVEVRALVRYAD